MSVGHQPQALISLPQTRKLASRERELAHVTGRKRFPRTRLTNHGTAYSLPPTLKTSVHCVSHPRDSIDSMSRSRSSPFRLSRSSGSSQTLPIISPRSRTERSIGGQRMIFADATLLNVAHSRERERRSERALSFLSSSDNKWRCVPTSLHALADVPAHHAYPPP